MALIVLGGLVGSSIVGVLAKNGPHVMGLHLLSFVGFMISGVFAVWLVWGIARSGQALDADAAQPQPAVRSAAARAPARAGGPGRSARSALRVDRRPERVQHRLLGRLDDGGEERVEVRVGDGGADRRGSAAASSRSLAAVEKATKISPLP